MKPCSKCKSITDNYSYDTRARDGLQSQCRSCARNRPRPERTPEMAARELEWKRKNREKHRANCKRYEQKYPEKSAMKCRRRRDVKRLQTPKWLTKSDRIEIRWAYLLAKEKTLETGIRYEVDHIIPLRGYNISGLHVPSNLQIITKSLNSSKGNKV